MNLKINKKRLAALALAGTMALAMTGCGSKKESVEPSDYWNNTTVEDNDDEQERNDYYEDPEDSLDDYSNEDSSVEVSFSNEEDTTSHTYLMIDGANTITVDEGDGLYTDISEYNKDEYDRYMIPDTSYCVTLDGTYTYSINGNNDSTIFIGQNGADSNYEIANYLDINTLNDFLTNKGYSINSITNNSSTNQYVQDCIQVYNNQINTEVYDTYYINRVTIFEDDYYDGNDKVYSPLKTDGYTNDIVIGDNSLTIKSTKTYDNIDIAINDLKNNITTYYGEESYNNEYNSILENGTIKVIESNYLDNEGNNYISYSYYVNDGLVLCFGKDSSGNEMYDDSYGMINNSTDTNNVQFSIN